MAPVDQPIPHPHAVVPDPLANAKFTLNSSGVAGFFGGDIAVNGMATVIFSIGRRFSGLYNTPGSLEIARQYGQLAQSRIFKGIFPGDVSDPSQLFGLDGKQGHKFLAAHSGSLFEKTGHLSYLIGRMARRLTPQESITPAERTSTPGSVTVIDLSHLHDSKPQTLVYPSLSYEHYGLLAIIPILTSIGACAGCGLVGDWWSLACILLGMLANGCACFILGSGRLAFHHPEPAKGAPPGDGILWAGGNDVVVILGSERAVNTFTRGRFFLDYRNGPIGGHSGPSGDKDHVETEEQKDDVEIEKQKDDVEIEKQKDDKKETHNDVPEGGTPDSLQIGIASILLITQFLAQLLLIPQASLFGQLMFVCTLTVSWGYNAYLSSINRLDIQTKILREILELDKKSEAGESIARAIRKFKFGTWTATATFACLALQSNPTIGLADSSKVLNELIPNDTEVWNKWKDVLRNKLQSEKPWKFTGEDRVLRNSQSMDGQTQRRSEGGREAQGRREEAEQGGATEEGGTESVEQAEVGQERSDEMLSWLIDDAETAYQRHRKAFSIPSNKRPSV